MTPAIETHQLTKRFRRTGGFRSTLLSFGRPQFNAIDHLDLRVEQGEVFGLLGPNGAGKTTLVKMLCTLVSPNSGTAKVNGFDIRRQEHEVRQCVGMVTCDERSFYYRLTGRQNLSFYAALYHLSRREADSRISEVLELLDMRQYADVRFQEYSTGMKQKIAIARGLFGNPKILFMDEPTRSLDPLSAQVLRNFIKERIAGGTGRTVVLATHQMGEVEQLCDRVAVISHGCLASCGTLPELRARFRGWDRYQLDIQDFPEKHLVRLHELPGLIHWERTMSDEGVMVLQVDVPQDSTSLPLLLQFVMQNGGKITRCALQEVPLEEVFASIILSTAEAAAEESVMR